MSAGRAAGRARALVAVVAAGLGGVGCASSGGLAARQESLRQALWAQHAAELGRDPAAVAEKLRRMARGNFPFFRGSAALYPRVPSRFSQVVALVGDPHPENVGTFPAGLGHDDDEQSIVDYNDFDQAGFGPFVDDLRRLALGLFLAGDAADVAKKHRVRLVEAVVAGYVREIEGLAAAGAPVALRAGSAFGGDLAALLEPPSRGLPDGGDELDERERAALQAALVGARDTLIDARDFPATYFAVKRAARARGGVASFFLQRVRVVVEGRTPGEADDALIELKETRASAALLVRLQRELQERPDEDPLLGHLAFAGTTFRMRSFGPRLRAVSVERLASAVKGPRWGKKDLRGFAGELGRLLARGHARAHGPEGKPGLATLQAALQGGAAADLKRETIEVTTAAAARIEQDVDDLRVLLAAEGPLLGWKAAP